MAQLQLADLFTRSERYSEALETYQAAFASNPAIPAALVGQARLYAGPLNSPEKALEAATAARELAPRDTQVLAALGSAKLLSGAYEEAYGILKDAAATLETDLAVVYDYARAAYSLGRIQEARTAMAKVASSEVSSAGDAKSFMLLTDSEALKQPDIAAEVEKALARNPQNVAALMLRGSLAAASGKDSEAIYLEILKSMPRFDPARVKLAGIYIEDPAKLDQALTLATEARSRMSDDVELTRIFAIGNYRKGDFRYAAQLLSEVSIKRPLAPDELFVLGMSFANSKQPEKARENLGKAITAGLSEPSATQAKATLAKLDEPKEEK
jgi:tetratricopeptide (TPR) repeat protein